LGNQSTHNKAQVPGAPQLWEYKWTTRVAQNGTWTLQALFSVMGAMPPPQTIVSPVVHVTVKNGYVLVTDAAKTYAKVDSPTNGSTIMQGQLFTLSTSHKITWNRFDNCWDYTEQVRWKQTTSWNPTLTTATVTPPLFNLPKVVGEVYTNSNTFANNHQAALPVGNFTAYAYSENPAGSPVATGTSNFRIQ
jgi:hypothetical protein